MYNELLDVMAEKIEVGSPAMMFEAYAKLLKVITDVEDELDV